MTAPLGPRLVEGGAEFGVWAPRVGSLAVRTGGRTVPLEREDRGVWRGAVEGAAAGDDYVLVLDGERERPDPRSRFQPYGVHGPSRLVDLGPPPARSPPRPSASWSSTSCTVAPSPPRAPSTRPSGGSATWPTSG